MDRRWLPAVLIGGGALVLVGGAVLLSGREPPLGVPSTIGPGPSAPTDDAGAPTVADVLDDVSPPPRLDASLAALDAAPASATTTTTAMAIPSDAADAAPSAVDAPAAETRSAADDPFDGGAPKPADVAARVRASLAKVESDIAALEASGDHDEAERRRRTLRRLQAQLDALDGGP